MSKLDEDLDKNVSASITTASVLILFQGTYIMELFNTFFVLIFVRIKSSKDKTSQSWIVQRMS